MARMLWAFNVESGLSEKTGSAEAIDDMAGTEGFVFIPKPFKTVCTPRGPWVRSLIEEQGTTHTVDYSKVLDQAGKDRLVRIDKTR